MTRDAYATAYNNAYATAYNYVVTFYPRWFTFMQSAIGPGNRLIGPNRISPLYHAVVAINDDTLYASATSPSRSTSPSLSECLTQTITIPCCNSTSTVTCSRVFPAIPRACSHW